MEHFYKGFQNLVNRLDARFQENVSLCWEILSDGFFKKNILIAVFWKNSLFFWPLTTVVSFYPVFWLSDSAFSFLNSLATHQNFTLHNISLTNFSRLSWVSFSSK